MDVCVCWYKIQRTKESAFLKISQKFQKFRTFVGMLTVVPFIKMGPVLTF